MKLHIVSASQWNTFDLCQRMWAFDKIDGIKRETGKGAHLGTAVHKVFQNWAHTGDWVGDELPLKLALSAKDLLPERLEMIGIERYFKFEADGVTYRGYIDGEVLNRYIDYKTSSNPKKYGLTSETMLDDTQVLIYAREYFELNPDRDSVTATWIYIPTRSGKPYAVEATITREHVLQAFRDRITPLSLKILDAKQRFTKADDLPYNRKACDKFGGCSHIPYCNRGSILETLEKSNMPSLRDRLNGKAKKLLPPLRINSPETADMTVEDKIQSSKDQLVEMEKPKDHKMVALIKEGFKVFTRVKANETEGLPYAGLRTWNALVRKELVTYTQDGDLVTAELAEDLPGEVLTIEEKLEGVHATVEAEADAWMNKGNMDFRERLTALGKHLDSGCASEEWETVLAELGRIVNALRDKA